MGEVQLSRDYDKSADVVWGLIGDFHGIHKFNRQLPPTESIDDGTARKIVMGPNTIVERLVDQTDRSYTYTMDDDGPLPVKNYRSTLSVKDAGDGTSTVEWTGTFDGDASAEQIVTMIYTGGLDAIEQALKS